MSTQEQKDNYCMNVCGGKCCRIWGDVDDNDNMNDTVEVLRCPKLDRDNKCTIHNQWVDGFCNQPARVTRFETARIERILREKGLPQWVEDQCVYAHPELLED